MSQWSKLIAEIMALNKNLRFEELARVLKRLGYTMHQPKGGSSHYIFRCPGKRPITLPKAVPMKRAYIELVRDVINNQEGEA